jgi:hypothetical protein
MLATQSTDSDSSAEAANPTNGGLFHRDERVLQDGTTSSQVPLTPRAETHHVNASTSYEELDALLARSAQTRDTEFDRLSKLQYWLGHFCLVYFGRLDSNSGEVGRYRQGFATRCIDAALERIAGNIERSGRAPAPYRPVPEIPADALTDWQIWNLTRHQVPFVVRGGIRDWPAVRHFTPEFLKERYGDVMIPINKGEKRPSPDKSRPTDYRQYYKIRYDSVANLIDSVVSGGPLQALSVEDILHRDEDYILKTFFRMDRVHKWSGHSYVTRSVDRKLRVGLIGSVQLFVASVSGYTTWHCAPAHNFFCQVYGSKYWTFADTAYTIGMSPIIKRSQVYQGSRVDARESYEDSLSRGFRLYPYIPKLDTTLEPGDLLFNPQYCWHSVRTAGNSPTIGIGVRTVSQPNLRSPAFQALRLADWESYRMIKASANQGRLKDDDLVNRIFEYVDPANRLRSEEHD